MKAATSDEPLIGIPELARWLNVEVETVYDWRKHRRGPRGYRIGGRVKFKPAEVRSWIEQQAEDGAA